MKRYLIYILLGWWAFTSCFDDKGNYDYWEINEVTISGGMYTTYQVIAYADTLRLNPQITSSLEKHDSDYEYEWKLIPNGIDISEVTEGVDFIIGRDKNLEWPVTLGAGIYSGFYLVKDKSTGITQRGRFSVQVRTLTSEGWLILCEEQNKARLDLIFNENETDDIVAHNLWVNQEFETRKPLRLIPCWFRDKHSRVLFVSEKGTYELDETDLHVGEDTDFRWRFGVLPEAIHIQAAKFSQRSLEHDRWTVVTGQGDVYSEAVNSGIGFFGYPVNVLDGERFVAAPFVGVMYLWKFVAGAANPTSTMLYDATHQQFLAIKNGDIYPTVMKFSGEKLFEAQTGKDFVAGESTYQTGANGTNYVILKDPNTGKYYFYGILMDYDEKNEQQYYGEVKGAGLSGATQFVFHNIYPYLFYLSNNQIYQFDMRYPEEEAKPVLSFPGEEVKVIKFLPLISNYAYGVANSWMRQRGYRLVVGTSLQGVDESECGIMRTYDVPNLMGPLTKVKEHKGLGKIVDIIYKEPIRK